MRILKRTFVLILLFTLPLSVFASSITDINKSISVSIPQNWKYEKPSGLSKLTLINPENGANILVLSQKVDKATLKQCEAAWLESIETMDDFNMLSKRNTKLSGVNARELVFTTIDNTSESPITLKFVQILIVKSKTLYAVQFVCAEPVYEDNISAFNGVRSSFKWLK